MECVYTAFAFVIVVLSLVYYHLTSTYGYWKKKSIPCLDGTLPGLGNVYPMLFMKKNKIEMYRDFYLRMPGYSMIGFYNFREPSLMVRDPELVKTVLSRNFQHFANNSFNLDAELDPLMSSNPFFAYGASWKVSRQQLISAFTPARLKCLYESVTEACIKLNGYLNKLVKSSNGKVELELKDLFSRYTADVAASAAFGVDGGSFESSEKDGPFRKIGRIWFGPSLINACIEYMVHFLPSIGKIFKMSFMPAKVDQFFRKVVKDVLKQREEQGIQRADFIQRMIEFKNASKAGQYSDLEFNDETIISHAASFFADGYETSSITLSFLGYELGAHPEIQDRVREEVINVVGKHGGLTYEAVKEMSYMDQVLNESMRLFPPFGPSIKTCTKEMELVGSDGLTCQVTPGMFVVVPSSGLQRDPKYWPDPEKFDPERFTEENKQSRDKFVFLPFGEGARNCPGMRMAMMQMKAVIATLIQSYTWEISPRTKEPIQLDPTYSMAAAVGGIWVNLKRL